MISRRQSGRPGTGRGRDIKRGRKPASRRNGLQAQVDERHAALVRLLATFEDPVVTIGLAEGRAVGNPLLVAACRSLGLILVLRRPHLARQPEQLAAEVGRWMSLLLEVVDDVEG
jgi:hypothetical protein